MLSKSRHRANCRTIGSIIVPCALFAAFAAPPALAQAGFADLEGIEARVVAALGAAIGEPGGPARPIDRRLRLVACSEPVSVEEPVLSAVTVRCAPQGWRIRIPLMTDGSTTRVAGAQSPANRPAPIIRRGDQVTLIAIATGFTVSTIGVAEQDGAPGDHIRVRTEARPAPVVGQVLLDGRIALSGFN